MVAGGVSVAAVVAVGVDAEVDAAARAGAASSGSSTASSAPASTSRIAARRVGPLPASLTCFTLLLCLYPAPPPVRSIIADQSKTSQPSFRFAAGRGTPRPADAGAPGRATWTPTYVPSAGFALP